MSFPSNFEGLAGPKTSNYWIENRTLKISVLQLIETRVLHHQISTQNILWTTPINKLFYQKS
jgi:hypothetical protein